MTGDPTEMPSHPDLPPPQPPGPQLEPEGPWSKPWLWIAVVLGFIVVAIVALGLTAVL
jgi:hypothetical protein